MELPELGEKRAIPESSSISEGKRKEGGHADDCKGFSFRKGSFTFARFAPAVPKEEKHNIARQKGKKGEVAGAGGGKQVIARKRGPERRTGRRRL